MSCVTCHVSPVTCNVSRVICHLSSVACYLSPVTCHMSLMSTAIDLGTKSVIRSYGVTIFFTVPVGALHLPYIYTFIWKHHCPSVLLRVCFNLFIYHMLDILDCLQMSFFQPIFCRLMKPLLCWII